ncbi:MAG: aldehyde dehydrogenase family protein [Acidobacteria bacterium]|nr:aldehyde dehydrogenase family protein [Acidobacteriota bacterium]
MNEYGLWIGGAERKGVSQRTVRVPFDGAEFARVEEAGLEQVGAAVEAARGAAGTMREMTRAQRSAILRGTRERLLAAREEFAVTIASESGKPLREARTEVDRGAATLLFSSEEANRLAGEEVPMDAAANGAGKMAIVVREPVGVIAAITPFNFPLNLALHKIGPALGAGNAVVHKPASATPVTALLLARLFAAAGLPAGALNVVPGPGAVVGPALVRNGWVAMVTFTGSAAVGLELRGMAGLKKTTLELGSNSAVMVAADADIEDAARRCALGAVANSGQVCISVQRIFVETSVADRFAEALGAAVSRLKMGHPLDEATEVSSLISAGEAERVAAWVGEAGGSVTKTGLATLAPTVLRDVAETARVFADEAFGPVVSVNRYTELDEAIGRVNASVYGLQASLFTRDLAAAFRAARRVHVGGFLINDVPQFRADQMPYGGVKQSGTGREGPRYAMEEMTERKLICWPVS